MTPPDETYTHGHHPSVLRSHRWRTAENSAGYLLTHLRPELDLLDVGCGPGTITLDLAARVAPGRVVGLDRSADVIATTARSDLASFVTGDVYALDFPDESFDVVHAHQVLQHLADPIAALTEMRRVCRDGGLVAARDGDYAAFTWYPDSAGIERWLELYRAVALGNAGEPDAGRRLLAWANQVGFEEICPSASVWCFATPEERAWWAETWAERVTASALADQITGRGLATPDELRAIAADWRRWAEDPDGWFVVPHGEIICRR